MHFTSYCIGYASKKKRRVYLVPIILEIGILLLNGFWGDEHLRHPVFAAIFSGSLLFAMGMQNALVSRISGNVVRTTHLTGMFTDLGIDLYNIFQKSNKEVRNALKRSIVLRVNIIFFFLLGGIIGGFSFLYIRYVTFFLPALLLVIVLFYDPIRVNVLKTIYHWGNK